jgi:phosphoribosylformimino-5-aminoimidazole carboxamide ribonucleotide (ProFAR) isomerase
MKRSNQITVYINALFGWLVEKVKVNIICSGGGRNYTHIRKIKKKDYKATK